MQSKSTRRCAAAPRSGATLGRLIPIKIPYEVPLDYMDPAHPALFKANTVLPWFERLRAEAPVHKCKDSQFGPYWSLTPL